MKLSIPKPCTEKYEDFLPTAKGGFCQSCQFEVVDFSRMSSEEIKDYFMHQAGKKVCGRFKSKQLNPPAPLSSPTPRVSSGLFLALSVFSVAPIFPALAQTVPTVQQAKSCEEIPANETNSDSTHVFKGKVTDGQEGLPFVNLSIYRDGSYLSGGSTDLEGEFRISIDLKKGDEIVLSYIGYTQLKVIADGPRNFFSFKLHEDHESLLGEVIIVGEVAADTRFKAKPSFWNRVKNIFREDFK